MPIFLICCHSITFGKKNEHPINCLKECVREISIISMDTGDIYMHEHVFSCVSYNSLRPLYKQAFTYCRHHIHGLDFYPASEAVHCKDIVFNIMSIFPANAIFLYKGGIVEKTLLEKTGHYAVDINDWDVPNARLLNHFPYTSNSCQYHNISGCCCPTQKLYIYRKYILEKCMSNLRWL